MPEKKSILNLTLLKDQVYDYLRSQMRKAEIKPGTVIDMNSTSHKLGISKTPLRDALIQLEMEGFVRILPRRGVIVNELGIEDIKDIYEILGALESRAIISASFKLAEPEVRRMQDLNDGMKKAIAKDNFDVYYEKNLQFHNVYIDLSGNKMLIQTIEVLKKRLYDFPRRVKYVKAWEEASILEHQKLIGLFAKGDFEEAAQFIRDIHWSFKVQEKFIREYYF